MARSWLLSMGGITLRPGLFLAGRPQMLAAQQAGYRLGRASLAKAQRDKATGTAGGPDELFSGQAFELQMPVELAHELRIVAPIAQNFHE
jgi:hypothetical protein